MPVQFTEIKNQTINHIIKNSIITNWLWCDVIFHNVCKKSLTETWLATWRLWPQSSLEVRIWGQGSSSCLGHVDVSKLESEWMKQANMNLENVSSQVDQLWIWQEVFSLRDSSVSEWGHDVVICWYYVTSCLPLTSFHCLNPWRDDKRHNKTRA